MKKRRRKPAGWLANLNRITPRFCRLVARKKNGRAAMTNKDIAAVSGLSVCTVRRLYTVNSWNSFTAETIHRFAVACGVDLRRPGRSAVKFFRSNKLSYMKRSQPAHKDLYRRLLEVTPSAR